MNLVPVGALEGLPCVAVGPRDLAPRRPSCFADVVHRARLRGYLPEVVVVERLDWDDEEVVAALAYLSEDPATSNLTLWHLRELGDPTWPSIVTWVVEDASDLVKSEIPLADLTLALSERPPSPGPTEVVVVEPYRGITAQHLDEIASYVGPQQGWVYASNRPRYYGAVARARDTWGLKSRPA